MIVCRRTEKVNSYLQQCILDTSPHESYLRCRRSWTREDPSYCPFQTQFNGFFPFSTHFYWCPVKGCTSCSYLISMPPVSGAQKAPKLTLNWLFFCHRGRNFFCQFILLPRRDWPHHTVGGLQKKKNPQVWILAVLFLMCHTSETDPDPDKNPHRACADSDMLAENCYNQIV